MVHRVRATALSLLVLLGTLTPGATTIQAATTASVMTDADAFVCTGSANNPVVIDLNTFPLATDEHDLSTSNFGGAGTLAISSASSTKGAFQSVIRFNVSSIIANFNATYGVGGWVLTSAQLRLMTNYGDQGDQPNNSIFNTIHGGLFSITWLEDDSWIEGSDDANPSNPGTSGITYSGISSLLDGGSSSLGMYTYTPPGDNVPFYYTLPLSNDSLINDLLAGEEFSLLFAPGDDDVSFLFNSRRKLGNEPYLVLTAEAIPEPGTSTLFMLSASVGLMAWMRHRRRDS